MFVIGYKMGCVTIEGQQQKGHVVRIHWVMAEVKKTDGHFLSVLQQVGHQDLHVRTLRMSGPLRSKHHVCIQNGPQHDDKSKSLNDGRVVSVEIPHGLGAFDARSLPLGHAFASFL